MLKKLSALTLAVMLCVGLMTTAASAASTSTYGDADIFRAFSIEDAATGEVWNNLIDNYEAIPTLEVDKEYIVSTTIRLDASNLAGDDTSAGQGCSVSIYLSAQEQAGQEANFDMDFCCDNMKSYYPTIFGNAKVDADMAFELVPGSLTITCDGAANGSTLDGELAGVYYFVRIGYDALDGVVPVDKDITISYLVRTTAAVIPDVEPSPSPVPSTGPDASASPSNAPASTATPEPPKYSSGLPEVEDSVVISRYRQEYKEADRPDYTVFNSVVDNPDYGNEFQFLSIMNATTGESFRSGVIELVAGQQYQVTVFCRNDRRPVEDDKWNIGYDLNYISAQIEMPYTLGEGGVEYITATLRSEDSDPKFVSASLGLVSRHGVSLRYVKDSAYNRKVGYESSRIDYSSLFGNGARLSGLNEGEYNTLTFSIQVVADDTVPPVDPNADYDAILGGNVASDVPNDALIGDTPAKKNVRYVTIADMIVAIIVTIAASVACSIVYTAISTQHLRNDIAALRRLRDNFSEESEPKIDPRTGPIAPPQLVVPLPQDLGSNTEQKDGSQTTLDTEQKNAPQTGVDADAEEIGPTTGSDDPAIVAADQPDMNAGTDQQEQADDSTL